MTAPRNNVAFSNPSPDKHYFLKTESEGLPSIEVFGKPHYRLGGVEIDPKANRARALTTRGSVGLTLIDPTNGATRTIETPKGALVNGATWSPDGKSIGYIASFDAATHIFIADVATGKSVQITKTPLLAVRVTAFDWTADGKSVVAVLLPDARPAEPKRPPVETGPLVRTSEAGKVLQNRNYASLLRDPYDKELIDYYTMGQLALIDVKTKVAKKIGQPALITAVDASPDGQYFRVTLQTKPYSYLVPVSNFGTVEQVWDASGKVARRSREANVCSEGTGGATRTRPARRWLAAAAEVARRPIRASAICSGIRSGRGSCISRPRLRPRVSAAARTARAAVARAAVVAAGGPGAARKDRVVFVVRAVRRERREGAVRGERPHDVGRIQRRRQDVVRQRGERSVRGASGRPEQALRDR